MNALKMSWIILNGSIYYLVIASLNSATVYNTSDNIGSKDGSGMVGKSLASRRGLCDSLENSYAQFVCNLGKAFIGDWVPGGGVIAHFLDTIFDPGSESQSTWDKVKDQVEKYVEDRLDERDLNRFNNDRNEIIRGLGQCKRSPNKVPLFIQVK